MELVHAPRSEGDDGTGRIVLAGDGAAGRDAFHTALQLSRVPSCLSDPNTPDDPLVLCNQAFERLTGYARDEVVGRNCRFLQGSATDPAAVRRLAARLRAGLDAQEELYNYRKDGTGFWNSLSIHPVVDPQGRLVYFFASQIDVTDRREAAAVLHRSHRLVALGGIAAGLAHEYSNIMTVALAGIELARAADDAGQRAKQLDRAEWGIRRAARLTGQLLAFTRGPSSQAGPADLSAQVAEIDGMLDQMAGPGCRVEVALAAEPLRVTVDGGQLELAVLNLVHLAAATLPNGGPITVATEPLGDQAAVSVTHNGIDAACPSTSPKLAEARRHAEQAGGRLELGATAACIILPRLPA